MATPIVGALRDLIGDDQVLVDPDVRSSYETDWTRRFHGSAVAVARPGTTAEVAAVLQACAQHDVFVVPQGGNTGLVGGGVPDRADTVVLSTRRLDRVEAVDDASATVIVGAGATLASVRAAAHAHGLTVGVDIGARESASIGGMVATNAGGLHVLRYGPMREQVEGIVAVLSDGAIVGRVPGLTKDNTGYSWPALFSGSEGTLAVITDVHLRLVPHLDDHVTALVGLDHVDDAIALCARLRRDLDSLVALEFVLADGLDLVREHRHLAAPFAAGTPAVALLVECAAHAGSLGRISDDLGAALADEARVLVATDPAPRARLWEYREGITESISALGVPHKLDVSLPTARLAEFVRRVPAAIHAVAPGARPVLFGHLGDGNVHVNVVGVEPDDMHVDDAIVGLVVELDGSISAEHGIGRAKAAYLPLVRRPAELAAFAAIRHALDPTRTLNPGVLTPPPPA